MHSDFSFHSVSGFDREENFMCKRGYGGVAFFWRKSLDSSIETLPTDSDRILAVKVSGAAKPYIILGTYLPSINYDNDIYQEYIDVLWSLLETYTESGYCFVLGDFNAKLGAKGGAKGLWGDR